MENKEGRPNETVEHTEITHGRNWEGEDGWRKKKALEMQDEESQTLQNMKAAEYWDEEEKWTNQALKSLQAEEI